MQTFALFSFLLLAKYDSIVFCDLQIASGISSTFVMAVSGRYPDVRELAEIGRSQKSRASKEAVPAGLHFKTL